MWHGHTNDGLSEQEALDVAIRASLPASQQAPESQQASRSVYGNPVSVSGDAGFQLELVAKNAELTALSARLDVMKEELAALSARLAAKDAELTATKVELAELTIQCECASVTIVEEKDQRHKIEDENNVLKFELGELKKAYEALGERIVSPQEGMPPEPDSKLEPEPEPEPQPEPEPEPDPQP